MIRSSLVAIQLPLAREPSVAVQGVGGGVLLRGLWGWKGLVGREEQARSPTKSGWDSAENLIDSADEEQSPP